MNTTDIDPIECIDLKELMRVTGWSRRTIFRRLGDGRLKKVSGDREALRFRRVTVIRSLVRAESGQPVDR